MPRYAPAQALQQLPYNHPGLVVDLGVGLWAWPVPWDVDTDGDFDLLVSCPDKPSNGVWLFENRSNPETKFPVFQPGRRLSKTVHYITPSYLPSHSAAATGEQPSSLELRVLSPGIEYLDFAATGTEKKIELPVKGNFYRPQGTQPKGPKVRHNQWRYVDFNGDNALDLVVGIEDWSDYGWDDAWDSQGRWTNGPLHGFVLILLNQGTNVQPLYAQPIKLRLDEPFSQTQARGDSTADVRILEVFGCPSPNFVDFDSDGDLDLLCGEFLDSFTYFQNTGSRQDPKYAAGKKVLNSEGLPLRMELEMIVPVAFDWDRDGDHDLIVGDEDGRVALVENVTRMGGELPCFLPPRYFQQQASTLKCGALATPVGVDWDNDGDTDIVSGNTAGFLEWFENLGPAADSPLPKWSAPRRLEVDGEPFRIMAGQNLSIQGPAEAKWGYTTLSVADWDGDGLHDIVFNSIVGRVQWLKNIGRLGQPRLAAPQPIEVEWSRATSGVPRKPRWTWWQPAGNELVTQWRTTPVVYDVTGDGLADLVMLDPEGYLALYQRERRDGRLVLLPPERVFQNADGQPLRLNDRSAGGSGRRKLCIVDWDGDGNWDILLNSSNADLYRGLGAKDGTWRFEKSGTLASQNIEGHDVSPTTVDFNRDSVPDFLGGAEDGRFYFLQNPR